jgi:hypothetical protein
MSLFRRPSRPSPVPVRDIAEAEIAVGSLAGIAPSEIDRHLLVVLEHSGRVTMSGTACREATTVLLAEVLLQLARQAHGEHESEGRRG